MTKHISNIPSWSMVIILALLVGFSSCKSKKKLTKSSDAPIVTTTQEVEPIEEPEEKPEVEPVEKVLSKEEKLTNYFNAVATSSSTASANASIEEALTMFGRPDAPVLIVIYKDGSEAGYDEPTTIDNYLHYLKDTKNNKAVIEEIVYDDNGQIKELVLKK
ncbi:hypothetical protein SAMN04488028_10593 [Reichenbachiella agariperforans]|uniref:Nucleoid-structuring protein H-NS n=1 Tax=Reichenbachiella agariperforans TaxID=156994 RepID=A0A1M6SP72_REIAG|nr:hypothetical protein [Reichenbachiella agariperforans]SHK46466.1 hypothetical protein SAMN04488028_10593 [Reichenbachiella agariperforans]